MLSYRRIVVAAEMIGPFSALQRLKHPQPQVAASSPTPPLPLKAQHRKKRIDASPSPTPSPSSSLTSSSLSPMSLPSPTSDSFISLSPLSITAPPGPPVTRPLTASLSPGPAALPVIDESKAEAMDESDDPPLDENLGSAPAPTLHPRDALTLLPQASPSTPATAQSPGNEGPASPSPAAASPSAFVVPLSPFSPFSPYSTPPRHSRAATALISPSLTSASPQSPSLSPASFSPSPSLHSMYSRKLHLSPSPPHTPHRSSLPPSFHTPVLAAVDDLTDDVPLAKKHRRSATEAPLPRTHIRSLSTALPTSPLQPLQGPSTLTGSTLSPTLFQGLHVDTGSTFSDRFIPSRRSSSLDASGPGRLGGAVGPAHAAGVGLADGVVPEAERKLESKEDCPAHEAMMRTELLGRRSSTTASPSSASPSPSAPSPLPSHPSPRLFRFKSPKRSPALTSPYALSPLTHIASSSPLSAPLRKIPKNPQRVLDAPALKDDFYLNLVDWSALNVVAVGLGSAVYLWSGVTGDVVKLCDLSDSGMGGEGVTSVGWSKRGRHLAVGTKGGEVQVWDVESRTCIRSLHGHTGRVGCVAWTSSTLASGSRDKSVLVRDLRSSSEVVQRYAGHKQEVCGLKWSPDDGQLASGGNDNKLLLWSPHSPAPFHVFTEHVAAVKALAWSPHQRHLLASGGGTADRHIRFFNTASTSLLSAHDTGSQVCNLTFSKTSAELLSTHGYSLNQMVVWKLPSMQTVATLTGHTYRVLYLALSPDGQTAVTGAGDETLRFWNVFPSKKKDGSERRMGGGEGGERGRVGVVPNTGQMR